MKAKIGIITLAAAVLAAASLCTAATAAGMQITEYMYQGTNIAGVDGEFAEFTNMGPTAIDLTGWWFMDSTSGTPDVSLSAFGVVGVGESVILSQAPAADFRTAWGLAPTVKVIGGNVRNLGRQDQINLYDNLGALVDSLTYGDPGSSPSMPGVRTQNKSCTIPVADLGLTSSSSSWTLAAVGDAYGSKKAVSSADIANPGYYYSVPEPGSIIALLSGIVGLCGLIRRRRS